MYTQARNVWSMVPLNNARRLFNSNLVPTVLRAGLQAGFLFLAPKMLGSTTAVAVFIVLSVSAVLTPATALGSQILLIRSVASSRVAPEEWQRPYLWGLGILILAAPLVAAAYQQTSPLSLVALTSYLLANYVRVLSDAYAQGRGKYYLAQWAYVGFWILKLGAMAGSFLLGSSLNFQQYAMVECVLSLPWLYVAIRCFAEYPAPWGWRFNLRISIGILTAGLTRSLWLEADRILLPFVLSPTSYLLYSLVSRALSGGMTLVDAHLAQITPRIVQAKLGDLPVVARDSRKQVAVATVLYVCGSIAVLAFYWPVPTPYALVAAVGVLIIPVAFHSNIRLDYVFYNVSIGRRIVLNVVGFAAVLTGIGGAYLTQQPVCVSVGLVLSYAVCRLIALPRERI